MKEKFLPVGTVVQVKDTKKNAMIISYFIASKQTKDGKIFDYCGCPYPEGLIDMGTMLAFNHDDIEKIVHMGCVGTEQEKFNEMLKSKEKEIREKMTEELSK